MASSGKALFVNALDGSDHLTMDRRRVRKPNQRDGLIWHRMPRGPRLVRACDQRIKSPLLYQLS